VYALRDASLSVGPGEVLAIVGDNGAGKSTMLKILSGVHSPDGGQLFVNGKPVTFNSPVDARAHGIATVYQDLALVECLDIATNMALGKVPKRGVIVDRKRMVREAQEVLADLDIDMGPVSTPVGFLSGGQRQIVALARAVRTDAPIILLDEPTAALGVRETKQVADIIGTLAAKGKAILCISHDMEFAFQHTSRVVVMRLGRTVASRRMVDTNRDEIVAFITGAKAPELEDEVLGVQ
jgi:simple sugar transport system ATP-binding protein/D-xylose transport system ATP-binding protein